MRTAYFIEPVKELPLVYEGSCDVFVVDFNQGFVRFSFKGTVETIMVPMSNISYIREFGGV